MLEAQFWTEENRVPHPVTPAQEMLRVATIRARPLPSHIVEELVAYRQIIMFRELLFQIVDHSLFWRRATKFRQAIAKRPVGTCNEQTCRRGRRSRTNIRHILFPHVPPLCR